METPLHAITVDDLIAKLQELRKTYGGQLEVLERGDSKALVSGAGVVMRGGKRFASINVATKW